MATVIPGLGHLNPMVPLLGALAARGHDVEVVVPPPFVPYVERGGLDATGVGPAWTEMAMDHIHPDFTGLDPASQLRVWTEVATGFHPHLLEHAATRRPDVLVHDHFELAAWLVGEELGIPNVPYAMTVRVDPVLFAMCEAQDALDATCTTAGRPPDAGAGRVGRWLYLDAVPQSLTSPVLPPGPTVHAVQHRAEDRTGADVTLPGWVAREPGDRPLVYVTLGTIYNRRSDLLERLVEGAGRVDADVLVTVGTDGTIPDRVPANVVVERYVPQAELYPHLSGVVCHGGFGTVFGAIAHGVPVACVPMGADQNVNATFVAAAGAGCNLATHLPEGGMFPMLGPDEPTPGAVAEAIERLLSDDGLRQAAGRLADEMAAAAPPEAAADLVERLVATGEPVVRADAG
jgi:UDP:flavonoid glycosyltransferase YjiC (YdhE family)